jgi:hypothetical protein
MKRKLMHYKILGIILCNHIYIYATALYHKLIEYSRFIFPVVVLRSLLPSALSLHQDLSDYDPVNANP